MMGGLLGVGLISRGLSKGFSNAASAAVLRLPAFTLHAPMSPKVGQAPPSPLRRQGTSVIVRSRSLQHKIHPVQSVSREELASYFTQSSSEVPSRHSSLPTFPTESFDPLYFELARRSSSMSDITTQLASTQVSSISSFGSEVEGLRAAMIGQNSMSSDLGEGVAADRAAAASSSAVVSGATNQAVTSTAASSSAADDRTPSQVEMRGTAPTERLANKQIDHVRVPPPPPTVSATDFTRCRQINVDLEEPGFKIGEEVDPTIWKCPANGRIKCRWFFNGTIGPYNQLKAMISEGTKAARAENCEVLAYIDKDHFQNEPGAEAMRVRSPLRGASDNSLAIITARDFHTGPGGRTSYVKLNGTQQVRLLPDFIETPSSFCNRGLNGDLAHLASKSDKYLSEHHI